MIIQVRGTSGSGKTTAMRTILEGVGVEWEPNYSEGRKKPLYYLQVGGDGVVLGHYESSTGGCDTIGSAREVFEVWEKVSRSLPQEKIYLMEGLLLSEDTKWTLEMAKSQRVLCLFLVTPIEVCLAQVNQRRAARGQTEPVSEHNTRNRVLTIERARVKLLEAGSNVSCWRVAARQVPSIITKQLRLHAQQET